PKRSSQPATRPARSRCWRRSSRAMRTPSLPATRSRARTRMRGTLGLRGCTWWACCESIRRFRPRRRCSRACPDAFEWRRVWRPGLRTSGAKRPGLDPLDGERDAVAATQAERRDAPLEIPLLECVEQRRENARAAGPDRVAEGHRAAVDVDLPGIDPELLEHRESLHGERLVQLEQVDLVQRPPDLLAQTA